MSTRRIQNRLVRTASQTFTAKLSLFSVTMPADDFGRHTRPGSGANEALAMRMWRSMAAAYAR